MEANIDKLGDGDSDLTNSDNKKFGGNSHLQFHNKPKSFTGNKKFKTDYEYYVEKWLPQQFWCYSSHWKSQTENYCSRRFTPGLLTLTLGTLSY